MAFFGLVGLCFGIVGAQETAVDDVAVFMRAKLDHSKNVLEGLALADFDLVARGAQELSLASQESSWQVLQTEDYARLSGEFRRACDGLRSAAKAENLFVKLPFREAGIDKAGVIDILENSGVGYPKYYEWRSRSGCTFCFFQQKIEWVRLAENHPDRFSEAVDYEKTALKDGSPFTWSQGESLTELMAPARVDQIKADYEKRTERLRRNRRVNPLSGRSGETIDDIYGVDEASGGCVICHK
jgi:hypothetical protein